jgi:hypothetical protein
MEKKIGATIIIAIFILCFMATGVNAKEISIPANIFISTANGQATISYANMNRAYDCSLMAQMIFNPSINYNTTYDDCSDYIIQNASVQCNNLNGITLSEDYVKSLNGNLSTSWDTFSTNLSAEIKSNVNQTIDYLTVTSNLNNCNNNLVQKDNTIAMKDKTIDDMKSEYNLLRYLTILMMALIIGIIFLTGGGASYLRKNTTWSQ